MGGQQPQAAAVPAASSPAAMGGGRYLTLRRLPVFVLLSGAGLEPHCDSCYILRKKYKALPNKFGKRQLSSTPCLAVDAEAVLLAQAETESSVSHSPRSTGQ